MARRWTITKGLRRLWLVASVGWMILVVGFFVYAIDKADREAQGLAHLMAEAKCTSAPMIEQGVCTRREYQASLDRQGHGFWLQLERMVKPNGWPLTILYLLGILLTPPVIVYAVVAGTIRLIMWIARGFASRDPA